MNTLCITPFIKSDITELAYNACLTSMEQIVYHNYEYGIGGIVASGPMLWVDSTNPKGLAEHLLDDMDGCFVFAAQQNGYLSNAWDILIRLPEGEGRQIGSLLVNYNMDSSKYEAVAATLNRILSDINKNPEE